MSEHSEFATRARTAAWVTLITVLGILFACTPIPIPVSMDCSRTCDSICKDAAQACANSGGKWAGYGGCNPYASDPTCSISCKGECQNGGSTTPQFDMDTCTL